MLERKLFQAGTSMLLGISILPSTVQQWLICTAALEIMNNYKLWFSKVLHTFSNFLT